MSFYEDALLKLLSEWQHLGVRHIHIDNIKETREIVDNEQILPRADVTAIGKIMVNSRRRYLHWLYKPIDPERFSAIEAELKKNDLCLPVPLREFYQFSNGMILFEGALVLSGVHCEGVAASWDLLKWNKQKQSKGSICSLVSYPLMYIGERNFPFTIVEPELKLRYDRAKQAIYMNLETGAVYAWNYPTRFARKEEKENREVVWLADSLQAFVQAVYEEMLFAYDKHGDKRLNYHPTLGRSYIGEESPFFYLSDIDRDNQTLSIDVNYDEERRLVHYVRAFTIPTCIGDFHCYFGEIDDAGTFLPLKPEYAFLEPWVREKIGDWVRIMLEEGEGAEESYLRFIHGEDWQDYIYYEEYPGYSVMRYKK